MATVIDEFIVTLGLDPSKFTKEQKTFVDRAKRDFKETGIEAKKLEDAFAGVGTKMLELATLFTGGLGITAFLGYVVKGAAELGRLAKVLDTNAQELWAWEQAGAAVGARSGAIAGSWQKLVHTFNDFAIGLPAANAKFIRFFAEQGVQFVDPTTKKMKTMTEVYTQLRKAVEGFDPARKEAYYRGLGLDPDTINLLLQSNQEWQKTLKTMEDAKKNGPNAAQIKAATEAQADFNSVWTKTLTIGQQFLPIVSGALGLVNSFATGLLKITEQLESWFSTSKFAKWFTESYQKQNPQAFTVVPGAEGMPTPGVPGMPMPGAAPGTTRAAPMSGPNANGLIGNEFLRAQRAQYAEELKNSPNTRRQLAALMTLEGNPANVSESMMNRLAYINEDRQKRGLPPMTVAQHMRSGFFGPINRGQLPGAMAAMDRNPKKAAQVNAAIDSVLAGRNVLRGATDQGMSTDPNGRWPGGRIYGLDQVYNDWGGGPGGHEGARRFREEQQAQVRGAAGPPVGATAAWGNNARAVPWLSNPAMLGIVPGGQQVSTTNNSSSAETHVGSVTVQTQATDAYGIASDMKAAIERIGGVGNVNNGPN